ncbi:MAG TPA: hypothetical protein PK765_04555 [bacterium]|nr:hypothetical protein [bacterium]
MAKAVYEKGDIDTAMRTFLYLARRMSRGKNKPFDMAFEIGEFLLAKNQSNDALYFFAIAFRDRSPEMLTGKYFAHMVKCLIDRKLFREAYAFLEEFASRSPQFAANKLQAPHTYFQNPALLVLFVQVYIGMGRISSATTALNMIVEGNHSNREKYLEPTKKLEQEVAKIRTKVDAGKVVDFVPGNPNVTIEAVIRRVLREHPLDQFPPERI